MSTRHKHYWSYLQVVWEGRKDQPQSASVVRYCQCGAVQKAFTGPRWRAVERNHYAREMIATGEDS